MDFTRQSTLLITCGKGLAEFAAQEIAELGLEATVSADTAVRSRGSLQDAMRLNLNLRTALNVLYLIKECRCQTPQHLYLQAQDIAWEDMIAPEEYLSVVSHVNTPSISNNQFANQKLKDAVVDRINRKTGRRPDAGPRRDNVVINVFWHQDRCWIYLNTTGNKLSDRGYRINPYQAPLQEPLAAAIILATGYNGTQPLIDPMCGSGTLAIEAALISRKQPPGELRSNYGFMHIRGYRAEYWHTMRHAAGAGKKNTLTAPIIAADHDPLAITAARENARRAGVDGLIEFHTVDYRQVPIPDGTGIVVLNPAYGKRLGVEDDLNQAYRQIGDFFKQRCGGYAGYIFTANLAAAKQVGLRTASRRIMYNADMECRLLQYELYSGSRRTPAA